MNLSYRFYYIVKRNLWSYKRFVVPTVLVSLGEPLLYLIAMGLGLGAYMGLFGGKSYLSFLVPGMLITSVMLASAFECLYGTFVRMIHEKMFDEFLVTPVSAEDIVTGDIIWAVMRGMVSGLLMLMVSVLLGIHPASNWGYLMVVVLMAAVGFLFASLSMIVTSFAPNFDFFNYYTELFLTPMFFFAGVFFPLDKMPAAVKLITQLLPLTHAVKISRAIYNGTFEPFLLARFAALLIAGAVLYFFALYFMKRRLIK
ncbi:MAG TPA: ABC transporter permease [Candidatus Omnitrophota bacterium]|nr:ABC transporter permease [Candidatus Omnitrophota bacterium]